MKKLLVIMVCFFIAKSAIAQSKIDWAKAPVNSVPESFTRNQLKIRGNVISKTHGKIISYFDKEGKITKTDSYMPAKYSYSKDGFNLNYNGMSGKGTEFFWDQDGNIIQQKISNDLITNYTYNNNGLWMKSIDKKSGKILRFNDYDSEGRIIKFESNEKYGNPFVVNYSYQKIGNNLEVKSITKEKGKPDKTSIELYNSYGDCISKDGQPIELIYDENKNIIKSTFKGVVNNLSYTYQSDFFEKNTLNPDCFTGNCINGFGSKSFDKITYTGFFSDGKRHGIGMFGTDGNLLLSNWENDVNKGFGTLAREKFIAQGKFLNLVLHGRGLQKVNDKFERGVFTNGKLTSANYQYFDNKITKGCTAGDCAQYYGKYIFEDKGNYTGFFKDGNAEIGLFSDSKGNRYNGEYNLEGRQNGIGQQTFSNGDLYFGYFQNGKRNGQGIYIPKVNSKFIAGIWLDDKLSKNSGDSQQNLPVFQTTPVGPGMIIKTKTANEKAIPDSNFSDLGFGDATPKLNTLNNTGAISRLYPGYPSSDEKMISKKLSAEAAKISSADAAAQYVGEKIQELYSLNKNAAFDAWLSIKPDILLVSSQKYLTSEQRIFFKKEAKKLVDEFLKKNPQNK